MTDEQPKVSPEEIYKQQFSHFSKMNDLLYKLPIGFSTIIGGLWFFGSQVMMKDERLAKIVFVFSAFCCLAFIGIMDRFGASFNAYIDNLNHFEGKYKISIAGQRWRSTRRVIIYLLGISFLLSICAFFNVPENN